MYILYCRQSEECDLLELLFHTLKEITSSFNIEVNDIDTDWLNN